MNNDVQIETTKQRNSNDNKNGVDEVWGTEQDKIIKYVSSATYACKLLIS